MLGRHFFASVFAVLFTLMGFIDNVNAQAISFNPRIATTISKNAIPGTPNTTTLMQIGNNYFLIINDVAQAILSYGGANVTVGQFSGYAPIGIMVVPGGFEVAWYNSTTKLFTIWSVDSLGNYLSNAIGLVNGSNALLMQFEIVFGQDFNGDGVLGVPPPVTVVIHFDGTTKLEQVGSNYFLINTVTGISREILYSGAPVTSGQFSGWSPIGAVYTSNTGYYVAWKNTNGTYTIWMVDLNGNYLGNVIPQVARTSTQLESYETIFAQDLNGDGVIGPAPGATAN